MTIRGDESEFVAHSLKRTLACGVYGRHYAVHETTHGAYARTVHEPTLRRWLAPGIGKCVTHRSPVHDQGGPHAGEIGLTAGEVSVGEQSTGRRLEALFE